MVQIIPGIGVTYFLSHKYIYIYIYMSLAPFFIVFFCLLVFFFIVYLYYTFHLLHNINSPRTEFKKKKN